MKSTIIFRIRPTADKSFSSSDLFEMLQRYHPFEIESKVMNNSKMIIKYDEENMNELIKAFHHIMGLRAFFATSKIDLHNGFHHYFMGVIDDSKFMNNRYYMESMKVGENRIKLKNMYVGTKGCNE